MVVKESCACGLPASWATTLSSVELIEGSITGKSCVWIGAKGISVLKISESLNIGESWRGVAVPSIADVLLGL